jgi:hypothetical protein
LVVTSHAQRTPAARRAVVAAPRSARPIPRPPRIRPHRDHPELGLGSSLADQPGDQRDRPIVELGHPPRSLEDIDKLAAPRLHPAAELGVEHRRRPGDVRVPVEFADRDPVDGQLAKCQIPRP